MFRAGRELASGTEYGRRAIEGEETRYILSSGESEESVSLSSPVLAAGVASTEKVPGLRVWSNS